MPPWKLQAGRKHPVPELEDFIGSPILILFYSIGCPGCKARALPFARQANQDFPDLQVIGIHTRFEGPEYSRAQVEGISQVYNLTFPVFLDQGHETYDLFGAEGTPHWILANERGELVKSLFGSMPNTLQRLDFSLQELFEAQS